MGVGDEKQEILHNIYNWAEEQDWPKCLEKSPCSYILKRLKQTESSSCPDCGMDPQDVPHLFNCTTHPTTLTPESLWDRPVKTIRELSFLDPENLD